MYGQPPGQPPYGQSPGQPPYGQPPYGQPGQPPYGQQQMQHPMMAPQGEASSKSGFATMMLAIGPMIFGICGVHRFYTGHIAIGVAQLLTFGGCGIWQLIDIITIAMGSYRDSDGRPLRKDHPARQLM